MPDLQRFAVFIVAALVLFLALVRWVIRKRTTKPRQPSIAALAIIVVPVGMIFARYSLIFFHDLSWTVYYGIPALNTLVSAASLSTHVALRGCILCSLGLAHGTSHPCRFLAVCRMA